MSEDVKRRKLRLGAQVFAVLVALEIVEYLVGTTVDGALVPLAVLALVAAWPIVRYYMHIEQLRRGGGA